MRMEDKKNKHDMTKISLVTWGQGHKMMTQDDDGKKNCLIGVKQKKVEYN